MMLKIETNDTLIKHILLIEDHPIYAEGIMSLMSTLPVRVHVTCAVSVGEAVSRVVARRFDLILLDLSLSDGTGHSFLNAIELGPSFTPIVIISGTDDLHAVDHAISLGACAYLSKTASSDTLRSALLEYLTHTRPDSNWTTSPAHTPDMPITITVRQRNVLRCMAEGMPNKSISRALNISENTVKYHIKVLYGLLAVRTRTDCLKGASRLCWVD
jgi:DNA-binding NarL/FixJ family response regulator